MHGRFFYCPSRAAEIVGVNRSCLFDWAAAATTSYGYGLTIATHGGRRLIEETDVRVMAEVNRAFPVKRGGPGPLRRKELMKEFANQVRGSLMAATP